MNYGEAKEKGAVRYIGKTCARHPDINGERYTCNWGCCACVREATSRHLKTALAKKRVKRYRQTQGQKAWRRLYLTRQHVKAKALAHSRKETTKQRRTLLNMSNGRAQYMRAYRQRPEIKATRAIRNRILKQHINKRATPKWANRFFIGEIYDLARRRTKVTGVKWEVDHILPLKHPDFCGLHVEYNLQVIQATMNRAKSNKVVVEAIG